MRVAFPASDSNELLKVLPAALIKGQVCLSGDYFRGESATLDRLAIRRRPIRHDKSATIEARRMVRMGDGFAYQER
jgi:hypothetical protein